MISSPEDFAVWRDRTEGGVIRHFLPSWLSLRSTSTGDLAIGNEDDGVVYEVKVSLDGSEYGPLADLRQVNCRTGSAVSGSACSPHLLRKR